MTNTDQTISTILAPLHRRDFMAGAVATGLSAAIGSAPARAQETPKKGGTLRLGMSGGSTSDTLDPRSFSDVIPITYSSMFWNGLVEIDNQERAVPELFESWEAKPGAAVWIFNVRRGITFTSGKTLDADDVIYSIGLHRGETRSPVKGMLRPITEIRKLTSHQIQFTLASGNADLPFLFSSRQLIVVPNGTTDFSKPDGTGAFTLTEWQPGVRIVATRKPGNYWKPQRGNFDRVELLYIGDSSARTQALLTGRVDAINRLDPKTAAMMMQAPNIDVLRIKGVGNRFAFAAHRDKAPFDNLNVMMGLKYGIDRQTIVRNVFSGFAVVGNDHLVTPGSKYFDSSLPQRTYDPDRAVFHFRKAGITTPIELLVSEGAFPGATDSAVLFQESIRKAGVTIDLKRVSSDGYWDNVWLKAPFCAVFWNPRVTADLQLSNTFLSDASWNDTRWKRPDFDRIILAARSELDETRRKKLYADAQRMISDDGGMINFAVGDLLTASSKKLRGDAPDERYELNDMRLPEKGWFV
jgi:peptide/nickel transport system substrate-binding protein